MSASSLPWNQWNIDANFLEDLERWHGSNPESSLDKVYGKICNAIEQGKEFFELIPDGAFPARGLVKALAHLVLLGKKTTSAYSEILFFTNDIVRWVNSIRQAFFGSKNRWIRQPFTTETWENLQEIRDIIDEICKWAAKCLYDSRRPFWEKLRASREIEAFKERIAKAQTIFHHQEIIKQSRAIDFILSYLKLMRGDQKRIINMLRNIKSDQQEQLCAIAARLDEAEEEARNAEAAKQRRKRVERRLLKHVVEDPTHEAQGKHACAKDTRVDVLNSVMQWVSDVTPNSKNFLWLTGDPGCGKSAITASLVEHCKKRKTLWAEFFINRNNLSTTNPNSYFPTIVHQFAQRSQTVKEEIYDQLSPDGNVTFPTTMSSEQAAILLVESIRIVSRREPEKPVVIIIDGLDETDRKQLGSTATIFAHLFNSLSQYPNAKIFISSRTEDEIRNPFVRSMQENMHVERLHLDTSKSFLDVASYLRNQLEQIWLDYDLDLNMWPKDEVLDSLYNHAAGLFIWAVTVLGFFRQEVDKSGDERLSSVLNHLTSKGSMDINDLYHYIITETYREQSGTGSGTDAGWTYATFRRLIGAIVVLSEPLALGNLGRLLDLRQSLSASPVDLIRFAKRLRVVLVNGTEAVTGETIPRLHRSFVEYVTSCQIDKDFKVNIIDSDRELGIRCLIQLTQIQPVTTMYCMPAVVRYASRFWAHHISSSGLVSGILIYPIPNIQNLREMRSTKISMPPIGLAVTGSSVKISILDQTYAWDVNLGLVAGGIFLDEIKSTDIPQRALSRLSKSQSWVQPPVAVGTSPSNSGQIGWALARDKIGLWDIETKRLLCPTTLNRARWTSSSATTLEGGYFAEAIDGRIDIWDSGNAVLVRSINFLEESEKWESESKWPITCLALSPPGPSGQFIAVGCDDGTVYFWDIKSGNKHSRPISSLHASAESSIQDQSQICTMIVFSRDGLKAFSCSEGNTDITMWVHVAGEFRRKSEVLHAKGAKHAKLSSVSFSPDGKAAFVGYTDGNILIWDIKSGEKIGLPMFGKKKDGGVVFIHPSENGAAVISGTNRGCLDIWHIEKRMRILSSHVDDGENISACILPGGHQLCIGSASKLRLWQIGMKPEDRGLKSNEPSAIALRLALSLDGTRVAVLFSDGAIHLLDVVTGKLIAWSDEAGIACLAPVIHRSGQQLTMFFTSDSKVITILNGECLQWTLSSNNILSFESLQSIPTRPSSFFDEDQYDRSKAEIMYGGNVRWIPSIRPNAGLWAFIGNHVLRGQPDGTMVIANLEA